MNGTPLGRYSDLAAAVVAVAVIVAWLALHLGLVVPTGGSGEIDTAATFVLGVVLGQRAATNGAGKIALAAHARLDAIHAPPAADVVGAQP